MADRYEDPTDRTFGDITRLDVLQSNAGDFSDRTILSNNLLNDRIVKDTKTPWRFVRNLRGVVEAVVTGL